MRTARWSWAPSRRAERREETITELGLRRRRISRRVDCAHFEAAGRYLEGTGSSVLDRRHGRAYPCRSPRTDEGVLRGLCGDFGYVPVLFTASHADANGRMVDVYHSDVTMSVGDNCAILAADTIRDDAEPTLVLDSIAETGRHTVLITGVPCCHLT